jgi:hypothetical protein
MQRFNANDEKETKIIAAGEPAFDATDLALDEFFDDCFEAMPLGDVIWNLKASPLANAIDLPIFRRSFNEIFQTFGFAGTFESYIDIFKKIFGDTTEVTFTVPDPGHLEILIEAPGLELFEWASRIIENNEYVNYTMVDEEGDSFGFQTILGFTTQYELELMLRELVPAGQYVEITLNLGE